MHSVTDRQTDDMMMTIADCVRSAKKTSRIVGGVDGWRQGVTRWGILSTPLAPIIQAWSAAA